jgi:hypothetical protein
MKGKEQQPWTTGKEMKLATAAGKEDRNRREMEQRRNSLRSVERNKNYSHYLPECLSLPKRWGGGGCCLLFFTTLQRCMAGW